MKSRLIQYFRANGSELDFATYQRSWVLLVADILVAVLALAVLAVSYLVRPMPFGVATHSVIGVVLFGSGASLLLLRFVGYWPAAHATMLFWAVGIWFLNIRFAYEVTVKTETVYLIALLVLPALLLGRAWMILYAVGTLLVTWYIAYTLAGTAAVSPSVVIDFTLDTTMGVIFVTIIIYTISGIFSGALHRVSRSLTEQQRISEDLRQTTMMLERSEAQKRQFYRNTIFSITQGKLRICDQEEVRPYIARAEETLEVRDASEVAPARHQVRDFCERKGLSGGCLDSFEIAAGEAIANAVKHAGGGRVLVGRQEESVYVVVEDHGPGIESLILPQSTLLKGYSTTPSLGLGYSILLGIADQVCLDTSSEGTTLVLIKSIEPTPARISVENLPDTW